jgi:hypothetical protein
MIMPSISVPDAYDGDIDYSGEVDRYRVYLTQGDSYSFEVLGGTNDTTGGDLDTTLTLRRGGVQAFDDDSGPGLDPHIDYDATRSGYYTLEVRGYGSGTGDYTIDTDFA